jgi:hypothetical protein
VSGHAKCWCCERRHEPRWLCDPAARILAELRRRGMEGNMPTIELPEPLPAQQMGLGDNTRLVRQIVVQAATVDVGGIPRPVVIFTGRDFEGPLPRWLYAASEEEMTALSQLVADMTSLAVRTAAKQRGVDRG